MGEFPHLTRGQAPWRTASRRAEAYEVAGARPGSVLASASLPDARRGTIDVTLMSGALVGALVGFGVGLALGASDRATQRTSTRRSRFPPRDRRRELVRLMTALGHCGRGRAVDSRPASGRTRVVWVLVLAVAGAAPRPGDRHPAVDARQAPRSTWRDPAPRERVRDDGRRRPSSTSRPSPTCPARMRSCAGWRPTGSCPPGQPGVWPAADGQRGAQRAGARPARTWARTPR